jgi:flagellar protein FlbD
MDRHLKGINVIFITRTNGTKLYINPELIQTVEATPDTVVTLLDNKKLIARDTPQEIADKFIEYRRKVMSPFTSANSDQ